MTNSIFIHVTKTAGSTLELIFFDQYGFENVFRFSNERYLHAHEVKELKKKSGNRFENLSITGEIDGGIIKDINYPNPVITLLRNPIKRLVSLYAFVTNNPNDYQPYKAYSKASFKEFLDDYLRHETSNCFVRTFSGVDYLQADTIIPNLEQRHLSAAKSFLKREDVFFGLVEYFDLSIIYFMKELGWKTPVYSKAINRGSKTYKPITTEHLEYARELNKLDLELFDWADKFFRNKVKKDLSLNLIYKPRFKMLQFLLKEKGIRFRSI